MHKAFHELADLRTRLVAKAHAHELQDDLCVLVHGCRTEVLEALRVAPSRSTHGCAQIYPAGVGRIGSVTNSAQNRG